MFDSVVQVVTSLAIIATAFILWWQLKGLSNSIATAKDQNTVAALSHCTNLYTTIMAELPAMSSDSEKEHWWYRYWNLMTVEFLLFRKGLLDQEVYKIWKTELALSYDRAPADGMDRRIDNHKKYLESRYPAFKELINFFREVRDIVNSESRPEDISWAIFKLVDRTGPKRGIDD